jgi:hypothetical protein
MMLPFVLALGAVAQTPEAPEAAARPTILILDLEAKGVDPGDAHFVTSEIARTMGAPGTVEVLTASDLRRLAALEGEKQAVGCDAASCLAEIASAMGAEYVVFGSIGRVGEIVVVELSLFEAAKARPVGRRDLKAQTTGGILEAIPREVHLLAGDLLPPWVEQAPRDSGVSPLLVVGGVIAGVGAVVALGGGALAGVAAGSVLDEKAAAADRNDAKGLGAASTIAAAVGAAVALVGAAMSGAALVLE